MRGIGWEYVESAWVCRESGSKLGNAENQCDDIWNLGGHIDIAVEMIQSMVEMIN